MADGARDVVTALDARSIYAQAAIDGLWMADAGNGIRLFQGSVVENDGSGAGRSDDPGREPFQDVSGDLELRKMLVLDSAPETGATIGFLGRERKGHQATLRILVNGQVILRRPSPEETPDAQQYWTMARDEGAWNWSRWYYVDVPAGALSVGENEIEMSSVDAQIGWSVMVADYRDFEKGAPDPLELPESSHRRTGEAGKWEKERGEYVLRFHVNGYRPEGCLTTHVIDAAGEDEDPVKRRLGVANLTIDWDADVPEGTSLRMATRTGPSPVPEDEIWSDWSDVEPGGNVPDLRGRYVQVRAAFSTERPDRSPELKGFRLAADAEPKAEADPGVRVVAAQNAVILKPSRPYLHEDYGHDSLQELRARSELDAVIAGAQTEFETIERLMRWAYFVPLGECRHFPWDVLDWLICERDEDGAIRMNEYDQRRRDKMCLYPNVALVAACLSFGIPARHVNFHSEGMTGHEIAEAWSNDYQKWVHLDATRDYYWYDPGTRFPLDTLEIHQALVDRLDAVERWDRPYLFQQDLDDLVRDLPIAFREGAHPFSVEEGALFLFRSFCHFRIIPRGNTFSQPRPMPVSQGTEVWAWDGYLNWADDKVPPLLHFNGHTNRRADFYPTLNQTRYTVTKSGSSKALDVYLESETPNFAGFERRLDRAEWQTVAGTFQWDLHDGLNVLEVRSVNSLGKHGIVSSLAVRV